MMASVTGEVPDIYDSSVVHAEFLSIFLSGINLTAQFSSSKAKIENNNFYSGWPLREWLDFGRLLIK
jgi:hypothetical protein